MASPTFAVAAARAARPLGCRGGGRPGRRKPGGHGHRQLLLVHGPSPGDLPRVASEEDGELVLLRRHEALQVEDHGFDPVQLGLGLAEVQLARDAALEAVLAAAHTPDVIRWFVGRSRAGGRSRGARSTPAPRRPRGRAPWNASPPGCRGRGPAGPRSPGESGRRSRAPRTHRRRGRRSRSPYPGSRSRRRLRGLQKARVEAEAALRARVVVAKGAWRLALVGRGCRSGGRLGLPAAAESAVELDEGA